MKRFAIALLLAGCASTEIYSPQYYPDYRTALADQVRQAAMTGPYRSAPNQVIFDYAACSADYVVSFMTPQQKAQMDAFARRERGMSKAEYDAFEPSILAAGAKKITYETADELTPICPDKVPLFRQYFH